MGGLVNPPPGYAERRPQDSGGASFSDPVALAETAAIFRRARARRVAAEALEQATPTDREAS